MIALKTAIYGKMAGTPLATAIGSRLHDGRAPQNPTPPYVVYFIISTVPDRTFSEDMSDVILQFSIFSIASGKTEILDINAKLIALYDKCSITASGWKQIFMELASGEGEVTDYPADTITGTGESFQSDVDFNVKGSRS